MAKRTTTRKTRHLLTRDIHPDSAGIDIGAAELVAAVPAERCADCVRSFATDTGALHGLRDWLVENKIRTVAMESTGNHWIAPCQILEDAGIEVVLVNARHVKAVPGRKTDVCDSQWLQHLHAAGLLRGSFRPDREIAPLRYLMRHRASLIAGASTALLRMQKVLTEMNIKLHHVFSDLDGTSALRVIEAVLAGERDPATLWKMRDRRCRATFKQFAAAIHGDWREEYLFVLGQCLGQWKAVQESVAGCDAEIARLIAEVEGVDEPGAHPAPAGHRLRHHKNDIRLDIRAEACRFYGVDLSLIDGVSSGTLAVLMSELGTARTILGSFRSGAAFASWMGLCPDNRISGGRVLGSKTRRVNNPVARALRLAAFGLHRSQSELGNYCRRMKARLGKAEGITATAHKLARIIYALLDSRRPYDENQAFKANPANARKRLANLQRQAAKLGLQLTPVEQVA